VSLIAKLRDEKQKCRKNNRSICAHSWQGNDGGLVVVVECQWGVMDENQITTFLFKMLCYTTSFDYAV
jgi:hypothetical protein